jgi:methionyl-tRNA formyltransferase
VAPLEALVGAGHEIALVVSRADTRRGRGSATTPSPVKAAALGLGLPVSDSLEDVLGVGAELAVVVAYGRIIPARILDLLPMVNVHFSLLPRWRGAAPVERAILAGDSLTGVCVMRLEAGLDTGPVLDSVALPIGPDEHASALLDRLSAAGAELLVEVLAPGVRALGPGEPQTGEPTYAAKLGVEEFELHFTEPAEILHRIVRLDRAWTTFRSERLRVPDARPLPGDPSASPDGPDPGHFSEGPDAVVVGCGSDSALERLVVQPAGKKPMAAADWRRGVRPLPGEMLGAPVGGPDTPKP